MELIKHLGVKKSPSRNKTCSYGLFECPFCLKIVEKPLIHGKTGQSCGCNWRISKRTHGMTIKGRDKSLAQVFYGMKARCNNKKHHAYHRYGGRGISVCREWSDNPSSFFDWALSNGWIKGLTVDRRDNDGNYSPHNCRITTHKKNCQNRSDTKLNHDIADEIRVKYQNGGDTHNTLAREYNVSSGTIYLLLKNRTWTRE